MTLSGSNNDAYIWIEDSPHGSNISMSLTETGTVRALEIQLMTSAQRTQQTLTWALGWEGGLGLQQGQHWWSHLGAVAFVAGGMDVLLAWGCVSQRQPGGMKIALIADTEKDLRLLASKVAYVISHVTQIQVPYYRKVMVFTVISLKKLTCNDMSISSTLLIDFFPPKKPQLF